MDAKDERVLLVRIEVGRFDDPSMDPETVDRVIPELLDVSELHFRENAAIRHVKCR